LKEEKVTVHVYKAEINHSEERRPDHATPFYPQKLAQEFAHQRW
jgi:hypothetical protein